MPRHLMAFRRQHGQLELSVGIGNTAEVAQAVREGTADIGLIEGTVEQPGLVERAVARDRPGVVVAPDPPWAVRDAPLRPADLSGSEWVMREPGSGTRSEFEAAIGAAGIDPASLTIAIELPSNEAVRAAVEAGGAATAISASVAAPSIEAGLLVAVRFDLPSRAFRCLVHAERTASPSAEAFLAAISPPRISRTAAAAGEGR